MAEPFLKVNFNDSSLRIKMALIGEAGIKAAARSLKESAERIMAESNDKYCPVETGNLRASGFVDDPLVFGKGQVSVALGYGGTAAPYALAVHENPRAGKTGGVSPSGQKYRRWAKVGQWKYLETPFKENTNNVRSKLIEDINREFRRHGG